MRRMREAGELGEIQAVQGTYSQDWLLYDTDWNWRIETGPSRAFADIGTHWCDMVEHITGCALRPCAPTCRHSTRRAESPRARSRRSPARPLQPREYTEVPIDTEDFGAVILRLGESARGAMTVSQVSAGRKNRLFIEIYGTKVFRRLGSGATGRAVDRPAQLRPISWS